MKQSEIKLVVDLDNEQVPEKIRWHADDAASPYLQETKSISLAIWDDENKNTLRIDLWTKDMPVDEMKRFYIDSIGGIAQSLLNSTGDEHMNAEINDLCDRIVNYMKTQG